VTEAKDYTAPELGSAALITVDVQRDTLDGGTLEIPGTSAALPAMRRVIESFRSRGLPIIHLVRLYRRDGANVDLCRRTAVQGGAPWLIPGSEGAELAEDVLPDPGVRLDPDRLLAGEPQTIATCESVLYKPRWGAFYGTRLESQLRELGVTTLVVVGCNFPNCPRTTIYEASERDFRIVLVRDAVSGLYERGERELQAIGVHTVAADGLIATLDSDISAGGSRRALGDPAGRQRRG
jgi:nicotinamidase-related amidase